VLQIGEVHASSKTSGPTAHVPVESQQLRLVSGLARGRGLLSPVKNHRLDAIPDLLLPPRSPLALLPGSPPLFILLFLRALFKSGEHA
jgi:hypothetical protein